MGRKRKKTRTHVQNSEEVDGPRSLVINRGQLGTSGQQLMMDVRQVMMPNTASKLKVRKSNVLKDFLQVAGPLGISHLMMFRKTDVGLNLRVGRVPRGPTLTFRVEHYCLAKDVKNVQMRPKALISQLKTPPLLVLNGFSKDKSEQQLTAKVFQNMFPAISVASVKLSEVKRVVLLQYDQGSGTIEFRHYDIAVTACGTSKAVKSLLKPKGLPKLGDLDDISEFIKQQAEDSDAEQPDSVVLPQNMPGAGNSAAHRSAIRLTELGPRMTLKLLKIEEGLCEGAVLYHRTIKKSATDVKAVEKRRAKRASIKAKRKAEQERNVAEKEKQKAQHREQSIAGHKKKYGVVDTKEEETVEKGDDDKADMSSDDDAAYYREEVGEEAPAGLLTKHSTHKKKRFRSHK